MKLAMIIAAVTMSAFGYLLACFWALDTFIIGEFERDSVPAGKQAVGLLAGAAIIFRSLLQSNDSDF